jgi:hypothetical protein
MSFERKSITEEEATDAILQGLLNMVEEQWDHIGPGFVSCVESSGQLVPKIPFVRLNFSIAMIAVNFRAAFDLFERTQAERLFGKMLQNLEARLGGGTGFEAVKNTLIKYVEAYNAGILAIRNPLHDVAMLFYYKIGLENLRLQVVDEPYFIPDPQTIAYLSQSMTFFQGRWELLLRQCDIRLATQPPEVPPSAGS